MSAGLLLAARRFADTYDLPWPTAAAVLAATGAGKTRAYEVADELLGLLPTLLRSPGVRPHPPSSTRRRATPWRSRAR